MVHAYFDNNASAPPLPEIVEAMRPALEGGWGNASSIHQSGQAARAAVERARADVAELIEASPAEIVFTSGGTESNNLAIRGAVDEWIDAHPEAPGLPHLITSRIEHHSVLNVFEELERRGHSVTYLHAEQGTVDPGEVAQELRPDTALISVMLANNETGIVQPAEKIAEVARAAKVAFHIDAIQAVGKIPVSASRIGCNLLSLSGHKIHASSGVGALYVRRGTRIQPMLLGGRHERERRAGSENVPGIVSLGAAARIELSDPTQAAATRLGRMRDRLEAAVLSAIPNCGVVGLDRVRVPNTSNIYFDGVEGEALVIALDLHGFCVSTGAACSSGAVEPSHVLLAMGFSRQRARSCLRFSLGRQNTDAQIDALLAVLPGLVDRLRRLAPATPQRMARTA